MKPTLLSLIAVGTALSGMLTLSAQDAPHGSVVPDNYIIALRPGAVPTAVAARHGLAPNFVYRAVLNGFAGFVPPGQLKKLQADPQVASVTPDRVVVAFGKPTKPSVRQPEVTPAGVSRVGGPVPDTEVGVAVVDTGIDLKHPDLLVSPKSYNAFDITATGQDDNGHGTHVGGIIAAKDDDYDVVGVAPGATLYAVKVLDSRGYGRDSTIIAGLDWVAMNRNSVTPNIRVVNMSLGRTGSLNDNTEYRDAIQVLTAAGITVVVAAGNDCAANVADMVPACYPEVIAVASTTALAGKSSYRGFSGIPADTASFFTTDGAGVAISAPGEEREDVDRRGAITSVGILSTKLGGGTTRMSGTSMAAPHVAGIAAVLYSLDSEMSPETVLETLQSTADGAGVVPLASPTACYTFDDILEGVAHLEH